MSRITRTGRDWLAPAYRSPWQDERATRFEPTTRAKLAALYGAEREPLWVSILAGMMLVAGVAMLILAWGMFA